MRPKALSPSGTGALSPNNRVLSNMEIIEEQEVGSHEETEHFAANDLSENSTNTMLQDEVGLSGQNPAGYV